MKDNKGVSIISLILMILIFILIGFIGYEVFYVDIFDVMDNVAIVNTISIKNKIIQGSDDRTNSDENVSTVEPIIDDENSRNCREFDKQKILL